MNTKKPIDRFDLRKALGNFGTGVTIVTVRSADGSLVGLTANSFNSVSLDPPLILVCLGKTTASHPVFMQSEAFAVNFLADEFKKAAELSKRFKVDKANFDLGHGDVVIAAITSCTNTSNPGVLIGAGLLARNAVARGLKVKPWVKTSLAPGSQVVGRYLEKSGLQKSLDTLGFNLVGYGCTTCIGNSGPLPAPVSKTINAHDLVVASVLSGNRNFEGRVNPDVQANYLASPPLVVAFALAGTMSIDLTKEPIGHDPSGAAVYLRDIWPTNAEINRFIQENVTRELYSDAYANVFEGDEHWRAVAAPRPVMSTSPKVTPPGTV